MYLHGVRLLRIGLMILTPGTPLVPLGEGASESNDYAILAPSWQTGVLNSQLSIHGVAYNMCTQL